MSTTDEQSQELQSEIRTATGNSTTTNELPPVQSDSKKSSPFSEFPLKNTQRINQLAILGLLVAVSVAIFPIVNIFFVPVVVAASFTTLFYPLYTQFLRIFKQKKTPAAFSTSILLFLLLVAPIYIVLHLFILQLLDVFHSAGPFLSLLTDKLNDSDLLQKLKSFPILSRYDFQSIDWNQILNESVKTIATSGSKILNKTSSGLIGLVLNVFILFFTMFYFFIDGKSIIKKIKFLFPIKNDYEDLILSRFLLISRATISGTLIIGLVQGVLGALALLVFGIKSWILWGFIMVVLSIIPLVGPWLVLFPAGLIQLSLGNIWQGIGILLFSIIVVSNIDNILRPRLVGQGAQLHELIIFFSSMGGIAVFGVMGFIVGPVIASLFVSVLDIYSTEFKDQLKVTDEERTN